MAKTSSQVVALGILLVVGFLLGGALAVGDPNPACFGAASRDPYVACRNPRLAELVTPSPEDAVLVPNAPCYPLPSRTSLEHEINACTFGVPEGTARGSMVLLGNSHAAHWRAAATVAAEALGWSGISITRSSCPFLLATVELPEPARRECTAWHAHVVAWFVANPEIHTVLVSDQPTPVVARAGESPIRAEAAADLLGWARLPASVTHIVVIRDTPYVHPDTLACITRAHARHEDAGLVCAVPRVQALKPDPSVIAAGELHEPRVQVVDLTRFFCNSTLCFPVVGGALVYRDEDHLTRVFDATLGPYLLHALRKLIAGWG